MKYLSIKLGKKIFLIILIKFKKILSNKNRVCIVCIKLLTFLKKYMKRLLKKFNIFINAKTIKKISEFKRITETIKISWMESCCN